jgi:DNA-binding MarR family transcriptional regulator
VTGVDPELTRAGAISLLDSCLLRIRRAQSNRGPLARRVAETGARAAALSPLALSIVSALDRSGPARVNVLVERVDAEISRVSKEVTLLTKAGYVRRRTDEADGRAVVVELTQLGKAEWNSYLAESRGLLRDLLATWDDGDIATFAVLFDRFLAR